jgi:adenine deaminase
VFKKKNIRFALSSANATSESLWYQAALSVGYGISRTDAIASVTTVPAEILGLGKRVGSLEVGKDGNVLLFNGDPLSVTSWVEHVVIEGREVYDRSKDVRVKHLIEGRTPPNTQAMGADADAAAKHDDGDEHGAPENKDGKKDEKKKDKGEGDHK